MKEASRLQTESFPECDELRFFIDGALGLVQSGEQALPMAEQAYFVPVSKHDGASVLFLSVDETTGSRMVDHVSRQGRNPSTFSRYVLGAHESSFARFDCIPSLLVWELSPRQGQGGFDKEPLSTSNDMAIYRFGRLWGQLPHQYDEELVWGDSERWNAKRDAERMSKLLQSENTISLGSSQADTIIGLIELSWSGKKLWKEIEATAESPETTHSEGRILVGGLRYFFGKRR